MGLLGWTLLAINLTGYMFAFRRIAGQLAWHFNANPSYSWNTGKEFPTAEQWVGAFGLAAVLALPWAISLIVAYGFPAMRGQRGLLRRVFYTPPDRREEIMRRRIAELERQVGVR